MQHKLRRVATILLFSYVPLLAQNPLTSRQDGRTTSPSVELGDLGLNTSGFEILNKNGNGDLGSYADGVLRAVREKWYPLIQQSAKSAPKVKGTTVIEFAVRKDGKISRVKIVESSGDRALDAAARDGIMTVSSFVPIPSDLHLKSLRLRFHFGYNQPSTDRPTCDRLGSGVYSVGGGVRAPHAVNAPDPEYSEEARKTKYQGMVMLRTTVSADGLPSDVCVTQALGSGLDEKAVAAVRVWKFEPATKDGVPVPVVINVEVTFHLY
jgi:TonB family protein